MVITLGVLALTSLVCRLWCRRMQQMTLWWDDHLICVGCVLSLGCMTEVLCMVVYGGLGQHIDRLSPETVMSYWKVRR